MVYGVLMAETMLAGLGMAYLQSWPIKCEMANLCARLLQVFPVCASILHSMRKVNPKWPRRSLLAFGQNNQPKQQSSLLWLP